jgi:MFS transporter, NNP family, nitrate/nitrite transporter
MRCLKIVDLKESGHEPTLLPAFLCFDLSLMVPTALGPLGAAVGELLHLSPVQVT